jgi:hypothetical protein
MKRQHLSMAEKEKAMAKEGEKAKEEATAAARGACLESTGRVETA